MGHLCRVALGCWPEANRRRAASADHRRGLEPQLRVDGGCRAVCEASGARAWSWCLAHRARSPGRSRTARRSRCSSRLTRSFRISLAAAGLTRDAGVVYAVGRLVIFAPKGSPLTVGRAARRAGALLEAAVACAGSRSPIPRWRPTVAPPKRCCASVASGTRCARTWCSAIPSRRRRSSPRRATPSAASSPTRSCSVPASRIVGPTR